MRLARTSPTNGQSKIREWNLDAMRSIQFCTEFLKIQFRAYIQFRVWKTNGSIQLDSFEFIV